MGGSERQGEGAGLAVLSILAQVVGTTLAADPNPPWPGYVLLVVGALAVGARLKSRPPALVVTFGCTLAYDWLGYPAGPTWVALVVSALSALRAERHLLLWSISFISYSIWSLRHPDGALAAGLTLAGAGLALEFLFFAGRRIQVLIREQQQAAEERKLRRASEERLRIAQELHDVLGHHLSLINVRAGVGLHLLDRQPEQARAALDTIKKASAEALREVQAVLVALFPDGAEAPRAPAPDLDRLHELTTDAGLTVHTEVDPPEVPAEIGRAAYRIVQESLTNVRRHAVPGATATVTVRRDGDDLLVRVDDDGAGAGAGPIQRPEADPVQRPAAEGNGLSGMRERTTTLGGTLTAGPHRTGWRVEARLPLPPEAA